MRHPESVTGSEQPRKKRSVWKPVVRVAISALCLALAYRIVDIRDVLEKLNSISWQSASIILVVYCLGQLVSAAKWRILVESIGLKRRYREALRAYFIGMFVNTYGLGTVGGDVARAIAIMPGKGYRAAAMASVLADRLHGLFVLTAIGAVATVVVRPPVLEPYGLPLALLVLLGMGCFWLFGPQLLIRLFGNSERFGPLARKIAEAFPKDKRTLLRITALSTVLHLSQIFLHWVIATELQAPLSFAYLLATVPVVNVASSLPFSVNGIGVREALYLFLFVPMGVSPQTAVAFGAVWIIAVTLVSALGGLVLGYGIAAPVSAAPEENSLETNQDLLDLPSATPEKNRVAQGS